MVQVGAPLSPLPVPAAPPDPANGFAFNLHNNAWGTNYVMWYPFDEEDKDIAFRMRFTLE